MLYQVDIDLGCMYKDEELMLVIKELKGKIKDTYFIWQKEEKA